MNYTYEKITQQNPNWEYIKRSDGAVIPIEPANSDYQAYLKWLADPNAPITSLHQPLVEG